MAHIRNLIFDFGKVLVDYDYEAFLRRIISDEERFAAVASIFCDYEVQRVIDREELPFDEMMQGFINQNREYEQEIRTFAELYHTIVTGEVPGMKALLTQLKAEGFKLYGLTNWCSKVYITMAQYDIFSLLDGFVVSADEHLMKPEPAIYRCLFDRFNLKPEECLFTDDRPENVHGGQLLGMDGIVFRDAQQYEAELRQKLLHSSI